MLLDFVQNARARANAKRRMIRNREVTLATTSCGEAQVAPRLARRLVAKTAEPGRDVSR